MKHLKLGDFIFFFVYMLTNKTMQELIVCVHNSFYFNVNFYKKGGTVCPKSKITQVPFIQLGEFRNSYCEELQIKYSI